MKSILKFKFVITRFSNPNTFIIMSFDFPFVRLFGVRNFVITLIRNVHPLQHIYHSSLHDYNFFSVWIGMVGSFNPAT